MIDHTEALPGEGWYQIAKRLGGSQASQQVKDANANYLATANGRKDISAGMLFKDEIVWFNTDKFVYASPDPEPEPEPEPVQRAVVGIYNGMGTNDDDTFYNALGGSLGAGTSYYTHHARTALQPIDVKRVSRGIATHLHFQSIGWNAAANDEVQYYPWDAVAAGQHDAVFRRLAEILNTCARGSAFSFDGEPEVRLESGSHQPVPNPNSSVAWPAGWPQNNGGHNTPAHYVAALRRIYTVMHPIAPDINYRFWMAGHDRSTHMRSFYPGDAYCDSIVIDPYVWGHNPASTTPKQKFEPVVNWVRTNLTATKPIWIGETGIDTGHGDAAGEAFWRGMPAAVRDLGLAGVSFFNRSNWNITAASAPRSWAAYVAAMQEIAEP